MATTPMSQPQDFQYVKLPDGSYGKFASNADDATIRSAVQKDFPDAFNEPLGGKPPSDLGHTPYVPMHSMRDAGDNALRAASNFGAGVLQAPYSIGNALLNPKQTAKDVWAGMHNPENALDYATGGAYGLAKNIKNGMGAEVAGNLVGGAAMGEMGGAAAGGVEGATRAIRGAFDPLKSYRSPFIPVEEAQARTIADKLGIPQAAYPNSLKAIQSNLGNIKEAGQTVGNKFGSPLEFGKVAQAAGQPAHDMFQSQLIEPNAEAMTPHGSIGDVYKEISNLNDQLQQAYRRGLPSQTETTLGRDPIAELKARKDMLTGTLYNELSTRSGLPVDDIRQMNVRGAGLQNVGNEADAAQVLRRQGFSSPGVPHTTGQAIGRFLDYVRGGPEKVAGRAISKVMQGVDQPATPLPEAQNIQGYRRMAETEDLGHLRRVMEGQQANLDASIARKPAGMGPTEPPQAMPISPGPEYAENFAARRQAQGAAISQRAEAARVAAETAAAKAKANLAAGVARKQGLTPTQPPQVQVIPPPDNYTRTVLEGAKRRSVPEPVPEPNPLDKYLGAAREGQEQARTLRRKQ